MWETEPQDKNRHVVTALLTQSETVTLKRECVNTCRTACTRMPESESAQIVTALKPTETKVPDDYAALELSSAAIVIRVDGCLSVFQSRYFPSLTRFSSACSGNDNRRPCGSGNGFLSLLP